MMEVLNYNNLKLAIRNYQIAEGLLKIPYSAARCSSEADAGGGTSSRSQEFLVTFFDN